MKKLFYKGVVSPHNRQSKFILTCQTTHIKSHPLSQEKLSEIKMINDGLFLPFIRVKGYQRYCAEKHNRKTVHLKIINRSSFTRPPVVPKNINIFVLMNTEKDLEEKTSNNIFFS